MLHKFPSKLAAATALTVLMLLVGAKPLQAYATCEQRIHRAERNLERAIQRHGLHSVEAERRRDQLERVRARCSR
jgi:hypothetical protein